MAPSLHDGVRRRRINSRVECRSSVSAARSDDRLLALAEHIRSGHARRTRSKWCDCPKLLERAARIRNRERTARPAAAEHGVGRHAASGKERGAESRDLGLRLSRTMGYKPATQWS